MTSIEPHVIGHALWWSYVSDDNRDGLQWVKFPITRITTKRVYFTDRGEETYCDRAKLEATGYAHRRGLLLGLDGPAEYERSQREMWQAHADAKADEIRKLRRDAADAHPDRGGTNDAFIAAHKRYVAARLRQRGSVTHG